MIQNNVEFIPIVVVLALPVFTLWWRWHQILNFEMLNFKIFVFVFLNMGPYGGKI